MDVEKKIRNSSIELLRIICMFGIILMHTFGIFYTTCTGIDLVYGVLINSVFNIGVTIFMLITGYYGAKFTPKRIIYLEITILFYSILGAGISEFTLSSFIKACFPIATKRYWYMSCYMIILCLSNYINLIPEKLNRAKMRALLLILILFFYLMPSVLYLEIMGDGGKGIANMLTAYLVGRYIRIYYDEKKSVLKLLGLAFITVVIGFLGNLAWAIVMNGGVGAFTAWSRDNSIFILVGAVFIFLAFKNMSFYSKWINVIAGCVFGTYLFETIVRENIFKYFIDLSAYEGSAYLFLIFPVYVFLVMIFCCIFDLFRKHTIGLLDESIYKAVMNMWNTSHRRLYKVIDKL